MVHAPVGKSVEKSSLCVRSALYGHGSLESLQMLSLKLHGRFGCQLFGGFTRDGCWEALVTFPRNGRTRSAELEKEIDDTLSCGVMVDQFGRGVSDSLLAFIDRINRCSVKIGPFPHKMRKKVASYRQKQSQRSAEEDVAIMTGLPYTPTSMIQLHQDTQNMVHSLSIMRAVIRSVSTACSNRGWNFVINVEGLPAFNLDNIPVTFPSNNVGANAVAVNVPQLPGARTVNAPASGPVHLPGINPGITSFLLNRSAGRASSIIPERLRSIPEF